MYYYSNFVNKKIKLKTNKNFLDFMAWRTSNQKLLRGVQGGGFLEKSPPGRRRQIMKKIIFAILSMVFTGFVLPLMWK
jgi:hypothetical protein